MDIRDLCRMKWFPILVLCVLSRQIAQGQCDFGSDCQRTIQLPASSAAARQLQQAEPGKLVTMTCVPGGEPARVHLVSVRTEKEFSVHYIYLDGHKLNKAHIDSLRTVIEAQLAAGTEFSTLVARYNMDGSQTGEFRQPASRAVEDFSREVLKHPKGAVFRVDVPSNRWYYVVRKDEDDRELTTAIIARIMPDGRSCE